MTNINNARLYRRKTSPSHEGSLFKKDTQQESTFFKDSVQHSFFQPSAVAVQRKCDQCEHEDKKVQRTEDEKGDEIKIQKKESAVKPIGQPASNYIYKLQGKGSSLPKSAQQFFNSRIGYDFGNVKIHTGKEAAESARDVNAKAYTVGNNIVFNEGQYNTESTEGKKLLAHELVHVVQQSNGNHFIQRVAFANCTTRTTGQDFPKIMLKYRLAYAREWVSEALRLLQHDPAPGSPYGENYHEALSRHFVDPTLRQRQRIANVFRRIYANLNQENVRCRRHCEPTEGAAFWRADLPFINLCRSFWNAGYECTIITLIHEAAHDAGIDAVGEGHTPYRGRRGYPLNAPNPEGVHARARMNNPDAYAFFAYHIYHYNDSPTSC
jgi:hypothetical protein